MVSKMTTPSSIQADFPPGEKPLGKERGPNALVPAAIAFHWLASAPIPTCFMAKGMI